MPDLAARRAKSKSAAPYAAPVCLYKVTRMKKNIAFFDFDGTITHEDTFTPFIYQSRCESHSSGQIAAVAVYSRLENGLAFRLCHPAKSISLCFCREIAT
jgi:hypothetical protein